MHIYNIYIYIYIYICISRDGGRDDSRLTTGVQRAARERARGARPLRSHDRALNVDGRHARGRRIAPPRVPSACPRAPRSRARYGRQARKRATETETGLRKVKDECATDVDRFSRAKTALDRVRGEDRAADLAGIESELEEMSKSIVDTEEKVRPAAARVVSRRPSGCTVVVAISQPFAGSQRKRPHAAAAASRNPLRETSRAAAAAAASCDPPSHLTACASSCDPPPHLTACASSCDPPSHLAACALPPRPLPRARDADRRATRSARSRPT